MKKNGFLIAVFLITVCSVQAQEKNQYALLKVSFMKTQVTGWVHPLNVADTLITRQKYLDKSKNQRTAGFIILGAGTVLVGAGAIRSVNDLFTDNETGGYMMIGGAVLALLSIPEFISSRTNARKAASLGFRNQDIRIPQWGGWTSRMQPAIGFTMDLSRVK